MEEKPIVAQNDETDKKRQYKRKIEYKFTESRRKNFEEARKKRAENIKQRKLERKQKKENKNNEPEEADMDDYEDDGDEFMVENEEIGDFFIKPVKRKSYMKQVADVKKDDIVYDLRSGDGKIVIAAAKLGAKTIGVEIDPIRILISRIQIKLKGLDNRAKIIQGNFFRTDIRNADFVTLFLLSKTMEKIENKLRKELRKGARVVSYRFVFKNWKPVKVDRENKIYLYMK